MPLPPQRSPWSALLAFLTYGAARGLDEPLRRYMERGWSDYRGSKGQPGPIAAFFFWMMSPAYFSR
jgi:hypothetical protein